MKAAKGLAVSSARRIVVVGGGANGTWMAVHLARLPDIAEIVLIDSQGAFGRGVAYSARADWHRLNVPAVKMGGVDQQDRGGFATWLRAQGALAGQDCEVSFVPRRLYGDYLNAQLSAAMRQCNIALAHDCATQVERHSDHYRVRTQAGQSIEAAAVVLCLGNPPPAPVRGLVAGDRLVADIWSGEPLAPLRSSDEVIVIGTGATAIDAALDLARRGAADRVRMISRSGRLPLADAISVGAPTAEELPLTGIATSTVRGLTRGLRAAVVRNAAAGIPWQVTVDALRLRSRDIWLALPQAEQRRFLRHARAPWMIHRHRLAPDVAAELQHLQDSGWLSIMAARVVAGGPLRDAYRLDVRRRGAEKTEMLEAHWVLNCTGPDENYRRACNPLVKQLVACGLARPGPFNLGLDCDLQNRLVGSDDRAEAGLFVVGPPTRGRFWEVTPAPSGRDQCVAVAGSVAALLAGAPRS